MSAKAFVVAIFACLVAALTFTLAAGIWTGDVRWLYTAWLPGSLAFLNFCFFPLILFLVDEETAC